MSDPVTNVEIEDVLSSIRRLLSSEGRAGAPAGEGAGEARRQTVEKLVLTPAQRVDEAAAATDHETHSSPSQMAQPFTPSLGGAEGLVAEATTRDTAQEAEADHEVPEFLHRGGSGPAREGAAPDDMPEASEETAEDAPANIPDDTPEAERPPEPVMPDSAPSVDEGEGEKAESSEASDRDENRDSAEPATGGEAWQAGNAAHRHDVDMAELEARVAEFEAAVAGQHDEWEPDDSPDQPATAASPTEAMPWQDVESGETGIGTGTGTDARIDAATAASAPMEPPLQGEAAIDSDAEAGSDSDEAEGAEFWMADDAVLDEEALRDMVAEIVRQELQGALGERITRNVRKLVRREIHRALLSQGLD